MRSTCSWVTYRQTSGPPVRSTALWRVSVRGDLRSSRRRGRFAGRGHDPRVSAPLPRPLAQAFLWWVHVSPWASCCSAPGPSAVASAPAVRGLATAGGRLVGPAVAAGRLPPRSCGSVGQTLSAPLVVRPARPSSPYAGGCPPRGFDSAGGLHTVCLLTVPGGPAVLLCLRPGAGSLAQPHLRRRWPPQPQSSPRSASSRSRPADPRGRRDRPAFCTAHGTGRSRSRVGVSWSLPSVSAGSVCQLGCADSATWARTTSMWSLGARPSAVAVLLWVRS